LSDPSKIDGDEAQIEQAFLACIDEIVERVQKLKNMAAQQLERDALKAALAEIGAQ
jgi:arsenate reductase